VSEGEDKIRFGQERIQWRTLVITVCISSDSVQGDYQCVKHCVIWLTVHTDMILWWA